MGHVSRDASPSVSAVPAVPTVRPKARGHRSWRPRLVGVSLAGRFLLVNLAILAVGGAAIGLWVGDQLERGIIDRDASITALYVDSFVEPRLESLASGQQLAAGDMTALDALLTSTALGERVVALRVWSPDGTILYSPQRSLVGSRFPVEGGLADAAAGKVAAEMSDLSGAENTLERQRWSHLLEMYLPVRERGTDRIIAVAEFYQLPDQIDSQVGGARLASWAAIALAVVVSYLLLYGVVKQGSDTITRQERALERQVGELSALLDQNEALNDRVRAAAERTTTLNERALRRISADLHDGPGQMLSLALMRLDRLRGAGRPAAGSNAAQVAEPSTEDVGFIEVEGALQDAMREMRAVAAGLRLPELAPLTVAEVAERAVADHIRRGGGPVALTIGEVPDQAALPIKIALFRCLQELQSNATRHAGGADIRVHLEAKGQRLRVEVSDRGPGFDVAGLGGSAGLGLAGIREQAELLGGGFEVQAAPGFGTTVRVWWPLTQARDVGAGAGPDKPGVRHRGS